MRYLAVLSLLAVILFNLSSGIRVASNEEMEAIADAHNRVARFINPSGTYATRTRVSTYSRSTRSSGSTRAAFPYRTSTASYSTSTTSSYPTTRYPTTTRRGTPNVTSMFNSTICSQAYARVIDQCLTVQGLNLTDWIAVFSSNDSSVYLPVLNRFVNILCGGSGCRDSILNAYPVCIPGISSRPFVEYMENVLDVACKVNEFGSTCAKTLITLSRTSSAFVSACQTNRTVDCRIFGSPCQTLLRDFSEREGCCALETYQLYVEAFNLFSGNSTGSSLSFPPNPWTACGLSSPGLCRGGFTTGTPTVTTTTKPPVTFTCTPRPKVTSKTIFRVIGRVWPHTDSKRFITIRKSYRPPSTTFAVLPASSKSQHWAIVFDSDLQSRNQFAIVSYPVPEYIVCVESTDGYFYRLVLERIPFWRYANGAPFYNPGCNCTFTTGDCYRNYRFSGQYIQHVATRLILTHNSGSGIFLSPLQSNGYGQCWVYPALQKRLLSIRF